jgi:predicted AAA+ superfamily ATPase
MKTYLRMVKRRFWIDLIEKAWEKRSIIWLAGVRRAGKTYLCRSLPNIEYFDC